MPHNQDSSDAHLRSLCFCAYIARPFVPLSACPVFPHLSAQFHELVPIFPLPLPRPSFGHLATLWLRLTEIPTMRLLPQKPVLDHLLAMFLGSLSFPSYPPSRHRRLFSRIPVGEKFVKIGIIPWFTIWFSFIPYLFHCHLKSSVDFRPSFFVN